MKETDIKSILKEIAAELQQRKYFLAAAESCSGGKIAELITSLPGASQWFAGSLVTYSNEWKKEFLGVKEETLANFGAVSSETVTEMLQGIMNKAGISAALAVSGIAGPSGAVPGKPVGTVFIGAAIKGKMLVKRWQFSGSRAEIQNDSVKAAIKMLAELLKSS